MREGFRMLVGHVALGLLGKRAAPQVSLGTLTLASMLADLLGIVFIITDLEHWRMNPGGRGVESMELYDIALSHSLVMDALWGALFSGWYVWRRHDRAGALIIFVAVVSHWLLDFISHRPDMPLAPGVAGVYGLGLWTSPMATLAIEGGLWLVSLIVYVRFTHATDRKGIYVFWLVVALLTISWISSVTAPAPAVVQSPVVGAMIALVFFSIMTAWAYWTNRLRPVRITGCVPVASHSS